MGYEAKETEHSGPKRGNGGYRGYKLTLAPVEEEGITLDTAAALDRARASLACGEGIPHEEVLREFGLSQ